MSLFGSTPPEEVPSMNSSFARTSRGLFDDDPAMTRSNSDSLFNDDDPSSDNASPWDMPTPRKQRTRADLLRSVLATADIPEFYVDVFDAVTKTDGGGQNTVSSSGVARVLAASQLDADAQAQITAIIAPNNNNSSSSNSGVGGDVALGPNEFNVFLALIGLAQQGEAIGLDGVDDHRRNLPHPHLPGIVVAAPSTPKRTSTSEAESNVGSVTTSTTIRPRNMSVDFTSDDPWNSPDLHKDHPHGASSTGKFDGAADAAATATTGDANGTFDPSEHDALPARTTSTFTTSTNATALSTSEDVPHADPSSHVPEGGWGVYGGTTTSGVTGPGFGDQVPDVNRPDDRGDVTARQPTRTIGSGRTGNAIEENILVRLMPEKEGMFMFQHHNYEVSSQRRGSKVIRRYSDFVWLLECLHKRYPFRVLPLLPPKRVAVNGNHLSNDGAFIEKRRRGLSRFLNALVRHPVLSTEQLVVMFLTVPTELAVWRKQATISVQDEFAGRSLPPGLEESLPPQLQEVFDRTRSGVRRSAELYITSCNIMDRLVKRSEGVANDHARMAVNLQSLMDASADTYATDTNDVPLLNDGLLATSKHLRTGQTLLEDEAKAWDIGVLEDLKRQRDSLVSLRDLFDRRDLLDRDNIPSLERRIQNSETKLATLRAKPEGLVKPGEIEKVVDSIIRDKESIVHQHNRSVFVKECIRDELVYFQSTQYHVSRWNQDWAQERVKYAEMLADNWRRLLDELDGMPTE